MSLQQPPESSGSVSSRLSGDMGAEFSPCREYRYALWRWWEKAEPYAMFVGLNPSTADETEDDPTIRRCKRFAADWGYGGLVMTNLFAIRATDPKVMLAHGEPIGQENDDHLRDLGRHAGIVVAAWGAHGGHQDRDREVIRMIPCMHHLGLTKIGKPKHPLYLRADTKPTLLTQRKACARLDAPVGRRDIPESWEAFIDEVKQVRSNDGFLVQDAADEVAQRRGFRDRHDLLAAVPEGWRPEPGYYR